MIKRLPEVIAIFLLAFFFYTRLPSNSWNRVIHSDGKGYYAHLPALFIYHDLEYHFSDDIEKKYYPLDGHLSKNFKFKFRGETVNKTFSGITILWLPFFLIAHFLSYLFGIDMDGYSIIYQFSIGISAIFYFWLGSKIFLKLLSKFGISNSLAGFILIAITFGTNLFYYLIFDPSLTHAYNFVLISAFVFYVREFSEKWEFKPIIWATICFSILLCIRPQDGFIALSIPFVIGSPEKLKQFFFNFFQPFKRLAILVLLFLFFITIPVTLWYLQTGYFLVYSYGEEGFDFSNPQFFNVLFSYKKGLFVYSPIILISLIGLIPLVKKSTYQFITLVIFLAINTYIISSWEEWWYGCSYGHRVFIDFYIFPALLLGGLYTSINKNIKIVLHFLILGGIVLNLVQVFQHHKAIVSPCDNNKSLYWENFLKTTPDARVKLLPNYTVLQTVKNDTEDKQQGWEGESSFDREQHYSGSSSSKVEATQPYSLAYKNSIDSNATKVMIRAMIYANSGNADPRMVIDLSSNGNPVHYEAFHLKRYMKKRKWFMVEFLSEFKTPIPKNNILAAYLWHPEGKNAVFIDDIEIKIIK